MKRKYFSEIKAAVKGSTGALDSDKIYIFTYHVSPNWFVINSAHVHKNRLRDQGQSELIRAYVLFNVSYSFFQKKSKASGKFEKGDDW